MAERHVWIPMADGVRLAASLYLPASRNPCPVLLEALPYRKDDVTAGDRAGYRRLAGEHGYAVARVDLRGTGSSEGVATDEYPPQEQADLCRVIARLAAQPWSTGAVGMYGTSYSGFNSLQVAAERPPALKAIVAIYATDDRYTDDVHYMGGALRLLDLVDYPLYMVALNALPPVPVRAGGSGGASGSRAWSRGCCAGSTSRSTAPTGGTARCGRPTSGSPARRCWWPAGPTATATRPSGCWSGCACRPGYCSAPGATWPPTARCPDRASTWCRSWSAGGTGGCAAAATASTPQRR
ncbi:MAG TPA: CocE/NonD family hydrolase [Actinomycetes bacterium]|jgi:pimeloyl-ACP methyl ester carboxylesterase